jgi:hypothetical protein
MSSAVTRLIRSASHQGELPPEKDLLPRKGCSFEPVIQAQHNRRC